MPSSDFSRRLVLNQWMLSLFGVDRFGQIAERLRDEQFEGLDESGIHRFHHVIIGSFQQRDDSLSDDVLLAYEQRIGAVTIRLNEERRRRGREPIRWKYFQYVVLLFTEIYLDRYMRDGEGLRDELNGFIEGFNDRAGPGESVPPFDPGDEARYQLNTIGFWMATGSGKTLLMHANILQFRHYLEREGRDREINRTLLVTPNEGLSRQHLQEFQKAGVSAEIFAKESPSLFTGDAVEIIEVTKLREESGDTTVAVDAFEQNNLVLVDEGDRGASSGSAGAWMSYRNRLCRRGFSFEYSATFGQAVKGDRELEETYARSLLVDYSYRHFYSDGFGKDYHILNLDSVVEKEHLRAYMVATVLSFYQQLRLFRDRRAEFEPFNIEQPLWVFVGSRVVKGLSTRDASDIIEILKFLRDFIEDRATAIRHIEAVLEGRIMTSSGRDLFAGHFDYLLELGESPEETWRSVMDVVFHAPGGGRLHVEDLKESDGEIGLCVGVENPHFGVITVGDHRKLIRLCEKEGLTTGDREFGTSMFEEIERPDSPVNLLIGARKFTHGWSSWRVSTMGLMNVGRKEGAQIIQLFGRGVRLRGFGTSLKRSSRAEIPEEVERPEYIGYLETLGIFGIRADYMAQFRDFLSQEGLPAREDPIEMELPVRMRDDLPALRTVRLKDEIAGLPTAGGRAYRALAPTSELVPPGRLEDEVTVRALTDRPIVVNWYPRIQALQAHELERDEVHGERNFEWFTARHLALMDLDRLHHDLDEFRRQRGWRNLVATRAGITELLQDRTWYRIEIPAADFGFDDPARARRWEEVAAALLRKYARRFQALARKQWEMPYLEYRGLDEADPNLMGVGESREDGYYRIRVDRARTELVERLEALRESIANGETPETGVPGLTAIWSDEHLFVPLLHLSTDAVEVTPAPINDGEKRFVQDLRKFRERNPERFEGCRLFLLRNLSHGRGIGFFEAGNFYPDFILWLVTDDRQSVAFVDPKGILHMDPADPKFAFGDQVKEIETRLGNPDVHLFSFIVSNTPSHVMERKWPGIDKDEMVRRNILFQDEDRSSYVDQIFEGMASNLAD